MDVTLHTCIWLVLYLSKCFLSFIWHWVKRKHVHKCGTFLKNDFLKNGLFSKWIEDRTKYWKTLSCIIPLKLRGLISMVYYFLKGKISKLSRSTSKHAFFNNLTGLTLTILLSTWASSYTGTDYLSTRFFVFKHQGPPFIFLWSYYTTIKHFRS